MWKKVFHYFIVVLFVVLLLPVERSYAQTSITLFTPYTGLTSAPGESITYQVDVINDSNSVKSMAFELANLPKDWQYTLTAGGNELRQLSVKPGEQEQITLEVTIPLKVKKDDYSFQLIANNTDQSTSTLPFLVSITEEGSTLSNLTTDQPNREGHADSTFTYSATLKNDTTEKQNYALRANAPDGWLVQFKVDGESVTSIILEEN